MYKVFKYYILKTHVQYPVFNKYERYILFEYPVNIIVLYLNSYYL